MGNECMKWKNYDEVECEDESRHTGKKPDNQKYGADTFSKCSKVKGQIRTNTNGIEKLDLMSAKNYRQFVETVSIDQYQAKNEAKDQ